MAGGGKEFAPGGVEALVPPANGKNVGELGPVERISRLQHIRRDLFGLLEKSFPPDISKTDSPRGGVTVDMKSLLRLAVGVAFAASALVSTAAEGWLTDVDAGVAKAKETKKAVMVEFTGSDWCPPCKMMAKEVFGKDEFVKKASEKYVLVKIDIPKADPELSKKNRPVMQKYNVRSVPTVVLLDGEGKEFDRFGASKYRTVESFIEQLDKSLEKKAME